MRQAGFEPANRWIKNPNLGPLGAPICRKLPSSFGSRPRSPPYTAPNPFDFASCTKPHQALGAEAHHRSRTAENRVERPRRR